MIDGIPIHRVIRLICEEYLCSPEDVMWMTVAEIRILLPLLTFGK